jgi:hypothetical protein
LEALSRDKARLEDLSAGAAIPMTAAPAAPSPVAAED